MIKLKDYFWRCIKKSALLSWATLFSISIIAYTGMIFVFKEKQLTSILQIAGYTVKESLQAGDWPLALSYLMKLEESEQVFHINLTDNNRNRVNLTGPFGRPPIGIITYCKKISISDGVQFSGCTMILGAIELITLIIFFTLSLSFFYIGYALFRLNISTIIEGISKTLMNISFSYNPVIKLDVYNEINNISEIISIKEYILSLMKKTENSSRAIAIGQLSRQVAHDIRSPLTALNMVVKEIDTLPEDKKILIHSAVTRIYDIANNLLSYYKGNELMQNNSKFLKNESYPEIYLKDRGTELSNEYMPCILESIISEKRTQYLDRNLEINFLIDSNAWDVFALINSIELKRILSNLLNNSIEAINDVGKVTVTLKKTINFLIIEIIDNGCGIPAMALPEIINNGISIGKKYGSGLGLSHAFNKINEWDGMIDIKSEINVGTRVAIKLPLLSNASDWFIPSLSFSTNQIICIIDDEFYTHTLWNRRFSYSSLQFSSVESFYKVNDAKEFIVDYINKNVFYLVDYNLGSGNQTGLDIIDEFKINKQSVLVTSLHDDINIQNRCVSMGVKILPKSLIPYIPIHQFRDS